MSDDIEELSPSAARAARDVRVVLGRLRRRVRDASEADDLTPSQASVLARLSKDGPASTSDLASVEGVRPQSMAATVAALGRLGLIERRPDPEDGRRLHVILTVAGRERAEGDRQARQEWLARALQEGCTERERRTVVEAMAVLEKLIHP
ncbi:MarR family winged helix-turn-helix transcriptional regulator [Streptomyces tsukubensis]|uniref:MarR family transcriptional regulator n=1 Tax=Streptomyces tsukubensis TaxID=83656 RepID=A0A1V4AGQ4_9ACTN|nr:MarR family transcriptional regulator [Streptomyces tsukubensis]OON82855.1 MarR family transcriptional regulator [Streptomyces tsukubensis]QFR91967.1 MarR family transcriptional regulator [Streptomyces tsukubensis]